jgi:DNA-binding NarL/FixJ family response regulator
MTASLAIFAPNGRTSEPKSLGRQKFGRLRLGPKPVSRPFHQAAILIDSVQMLDELQRKDQRLEQLVDQLIGETGRRPATSVDLLAPLTRREQQVLELLVDGLTNREIALRLVVEPDTVKDHVQSIIKKLGATDRTHAAVIAIRGGIVS